MTRQHGDEAIRGRFPDWSLLFTLRFVQSRNRPLIWIEVRSIKEPSPDLENNGAVKQKTNNTSYRSQKWYFVQIPSNLSSVLRLESSTAYTNNNNFVSSSTNTNNQTTTYTYNTTSGLLQSVTDPCGNTTSYTYTAMGQIKKVSMPSYDITYAYDDDRLTEINSKGTTYEIGYDALGRQTTVSAGDVTLSENEYTNNRLTASTTSGRRTEYSYDALDRITQIEYDQLGEKEIFYGANGLVSYTVDTDASTHTRYIYDSAERLTSEIEYNTEDLHDNSTITAGVYYSYRGGSNELSSVSRRANGSTDTINLTYGALASGTRPGYVYSEKYGTYAYLDYTYDTLGRLSTKTVVGNQTYTYAYRPFENNRTSMQVQSLSTPAGTYTYTYDDNGNIETETLNGNTTSYTYDTWGRMTEEANQAAGKRYVYGYAYGNLQYRKTYAYSDSDHINCLQTDTFGYTDPDLKDRLTSYNGTSIGYGSTGTGMWIGGSSVFFADAGLVSLDNAHGVSYSYDSSLRRKQKTANGVTTQYYYAGDELMAQTKGSTTLRFKRSAAGEYVGLKYNNTNYYYVKNLQGDVIGIADANGTVKVSYLYDAWGRVLDITGTLASTLGADNPIRYRSYYYDTETGWYFLGSRYYNPEWCRFISADVILGANQDIVSYNLYAYCSFDPVNYCDPNGYRVEMSAGIPKTNKKRNRYPIIDYKMALFDYGKVIDLGGNWKARIDQGTPDIPGKEDHVHVFRKKSGKHDYSQNRDGSKHHRGGPEGSPPDKVKEKLKEKTGWDWDGNLNLNNDFCLEPSYNTNLLNGTIVGTAIMFTFSVIYFVCTGDPSFVNCAIP